MSEGGPDVDFVAAFEEFLVEKAAALVVEVSEVF